MRPTRPLLIGLLMAAGAAPCLAATTQFLLLPMKESVGPATRAVVIESPHRISFKALDCATTVNLGGVVTEITQPDSSKNYTGTAYAGELKLESGGAVSGFVMNRPMPVGTRLSGFKVIEDGQTCSELIDGKPYVFKKYVAEVSR